MLKSKGTPTGPCKHCMHTSVQPAITIDGGDPDPMGYAENIFNGLDYFHDKELQDVFATEIREMVLRMNGSYKNENSPEVLFPLQTEIGIYRNLCTNYSDYKDWIDGRLIEILEKLFFCEGGGWKAQETCCGKCQKRTGREGDVGNANGDGRAKHEAQYLSKSLGFSTGVLAESHCFPMSSIAPCPPSVRGKT